ncbi:MAG: hypothetical protein QGG64_19670, partial [Candidatus Latescibacteria bacterium]|nr:hypothetical protein [Candidatus Latescibacterota bacterium]
NGKPGKKGDSRKLMNFLRYSSNAWGQRVLEGVSWDLFWYFVGAGAVFIVLHASYMHFFVNRAKQSK